MNFRFRMPARRKLACAAALILLLPPAPRLAAHVSLRPAQPLRPGGYATVTLNVPSERHVPTVAVTLEVPDAFLNAGGRLSRVEYPAGWVVEFEKQDKPGDVFQQEMDERGERANASGGGEKTPEQLAEEEAMAALRRQWIKRVTFSGGSIPADGFKNFLLSFQLPGQPGAFRFPAIQKYSDGREISWSELVEGADRPAPALEIEAGQPSSSKLGEYALHTLGGVIILVVGWMLGRSRPRTA